MWVLRFLTPHTVSRTELYALLPPPHPPKIFTSMLQLVCPILPITAVDLSNTSHYCSWSVRYFPLLQLICPILPITAVDLSDTSHYCSWSVQYFPLLQLICPILPITAVDLSNTSHYCSWSVRYFPLLQLVCLILSIIVIGPIFPITAVGLSDTSPYCSWSVWHFPLLQLVCPILPITAAGLSNTSHYCSWSVQYFLLLQLVCPTLPITAVGLSDTFQRENESTHQLSYTQNMARTFHHWIILLYQSELPLNPFNAYRPSADSPHNRLSKCLWADHWRLASFSNVPSLLFRAMDTERGCIVSSMCHKNKNSKWPHAMAKTPFSSEMTGWLDSPLSIVSKHGVTTFDKQKQQPKSANSHSWAGFANDLGWRWQLRWSFIWSVTGTWKWGKRWGGNCWQLMFVNSWVRLPKRKGNRTTQVGVLSKRGRT